MNSSKDQEKEIKSEEVPFEPEIEVPDAASFDEYEDAINAR